MAMPAFFSVGPTAPIQGNVGSKVLWFDTTLNIFKYWDGTTWISLSPPSTDPWQFSNLMADFSTTLATVVDTPMAFTPLANLTYEFQAILMLRTANNAINPRIGLAWPTGLVDGVAEIQQTNTVTANLVALGNIGAPLLIAGAGLPNNTQSWPCSIRGIVKCGASPVGTIKVQLASKTAGTSVTIKVGSYLKYRSY